jgi:DNA-binding NarL/FixJ family response regulator
MTYNETHLGGSLMAASPHSTCNPISILLVDDHPVVRDGLNAVLSLEPDMKIVGEAGTAQEAIAAYSKLRPAIVLMDLLLPDVNGAEAIRRICDASPNARVIVLTSVAGDEEIYQALEAGARGYLLKDMVRRELVHAVREVNAGRRYIPPAVGTRIAENLPRPNLTPREVEVLKLIASGVRNKEIAFQMDVSEATVNAHLKHIFVKLNVTDRTQAIMVALRRGIIRV